jgi:HEAT repeat protein
MDRSISDMGKPTAKWDIHARELAKKAIGDKKLLDELLKGILSKQDKTRFTSFRALSFIGEERPELLYRYWDCFASLIDSENTHSKYIAIYLIASLTVVDKENRFERIFNNYFALLDDRSIIHAAHVAANSGKIARARPKLQTEITSKLLSIDRTHHEPHRRELIKSYAVEAFNEYFEQAKNKESIIAFVRKQLKSESPKTRKKAGEFLERWNVK